MRLDDPIENLPGIGPKSSALLANLGITVVRDLLFHFPRSYEDRRRITPIAEAAAIKGETVTIQGRVVKTRTVRLRRKLSLAVVDIEDDSGSIKATWFGRGFLARTFVRGARGVFTGKVGEYKGPALKNPEYEMFSGDERDNLHTGRVVPIYPLTQKITQRSLRQWIAAALDFVEEPFEESLPAYLLEKYSFPHIDSALRTVHFPAELEDARSARARFAYEELLAIQLGIARSRRHRRHDERGCVHITDGPRLEKLPRRLPFELTTAQERAVEEILRDMESERPMYRLLQGDVGCGKTIVALYAIASALDGGYQAAIMAPTEILAEQHFMWLRDWVGPLDIRAELLTGSTSGSSAVRRAIAGRGVDLVVGTHALLTEGTTFDNLGLVIIDEQHRFGVVQRSVLAKKGLNPDILQMTATPIPRTLAITVYGGMDLTLIDELPPGRLPVKTRRVPESKIEDLYRYILEQAHRGYQTYFVCPLVEKSDKKDLAAVTTHFDDLSHSVFSELRTALLHGRMAAHEKESAMRAFKQGELDVLFSTSVIEVGIDAPHATTMVIEDAAQFGLTQLHQLRGRVGRGSRQSHCFLLGKAKTKDGKRRLDALCAGSGGFDIAEADLELRGPGEFYGVKQAGLTDLKVADLVRDVRLIESARRDAEEILHRDPGLESAGHQGLADLSRRFELVNA